MPRMTLDDVKAMSTDWITPAVAASVLEMDSGRLIEYARTGQLPFATRISGNRVKICRKSFLDAYGYGEEAKKEPTTEQLMEQMAAEIRAIKELLTKAVQKGGA